MRHAIYTGDRFPQWKGHLFVGAMRGNHLERVTIDANGLPQHPWEPLLTELKQLIREVRQGPDRLLHVLTDEDSGSAAEDRTRVKRIRRAVAD